MQTMTNNNLYRNQNTYMIVIGVLSVAIPVVVALLLYMPQTGKLGDINVSFLPHLNAVLNSATALSLMAGFYFVNKGNVMAHRTSMLSAVGLSSLFLVSYVIYHFQAPHTKFGGEGLVKAVYLLILLTHIVLAAVIVPFVLLSIYYAFSEQIVKHKKLVKWTFPMWLYVAVSGVVVYLMISPYYAK
jgi:putative membrane protein